MLACFGCCFVLCSVSNSAANISDTINSIPILNDTNFKEWQKNVFIVLKIVDLNLTLRVDKLAELIAESTYDDKREMKKLKLSNYISLMIMKRVITEVFRGIMSDKVIRQRDF